MGPYSSAFPLEIEAEYNFNYNWHNSLYACGFIFNKIEGFVFFFFFSGWNVLTGLNHLDLFPVLNLQVSTG